MANAVKQQKAVYDKSSRPNPLGFYIFPLMAGILSIVVPHESRPYSIAVGLVMFLLLIFALWVTFLNKNSKRLYNLYLSITMVMTSVITLMPGLKISVGVFWKVFLLVFWCIVCLVTFYGERLFPSKKFPMWAVLIFVLLFILFAWIAGNGAVSSKGMVYASRLDDKHILASLFGEEKGWKLAYYLYSISLSSLSLMFSKTIWTVRKKLEI